MGGLVRWEGRKNKSVCGTAFAADHADENANDRGWLLSICDPGRPGSYLRSFAFSAESVAIAVPKTPSFRRFSRAIVVVFAAFPYENSRSQRENLAFPQGKPLAYALEPYTFRRDGPAVSG